MKTISCLRIIAVVAICTCTLASNAYDFMEGDLAYNYNPDGKSVTVTYEHDKVGRTYDLSGPLVIPEQVTHDGNVYSVTAIGEYAFYNCDLLTGTLVIPECVTYIGERAFSYCSYLTGTLKIPDSVKFIGNDAFSYCYGMTELIIGESVETIGHGAFYASGFTGSLNIPNSVKSIEGWAFVCNFSGSLTIGKSIEYLEGDVFVHCNSFTELNWNAINCTSIGGLNKSKIEQFSIGNEVKVIPDQFLEGANVSGILNLPNSVTTIGNNAFNGCKGFTGSLIIGNNVNSIGDNAFNGCSGLTGSLCIPDAVTSIGNNAFKDCKGFTGSLIIGNNVNSIGDNAFDGCSGLTGSLCIPDAVTSIGNNAFKYCSFTGSLTVGNSVTSIGFDAFRGSMFTELNWNAISCRTNGWLFTGNVETVSIGNCVEIIPISLAAGSKIAFVEIPNSVNTICESSFSGCTGLAKIEIPSSVKNIGKEAFAYCSGVTKVLFNNSACTIDERAFSYCGSLAKVDFGNAVTSIGHGAFEGCSLLTNVVVPASVRHIGSQAFSSRYVNSISVADGNTVYDSQNKCNAIIERQNRKLIFGCKNSFIPDGVTCIGDSAFYWDTYDNHISISHILFPATVKSIGSYAFESFPVSRIVLNEGLEVIGDHAFENSLRIQEINIPSSVSSIGEYAFAGCSYMYEIFSGLENVPSSLSNIGQYAFYGCKALNAIHTREQWLFDFNANALLDVNRSQCILYVPKGMIDDFRNHDVWGTFSTIKNEPVKLRYNVISDTDKTVEVVHDDYAGQIIIPSTTEIAGIIYTVAGIGSEAFSHCEITSLSIPETVTTIGEKAFIDTPQLSSINVSSYNPVFDSRNNCSAVIHTSSETLMAGCQNSIIPNNVINIGADAFYGCSTLQGITIPNTVLRIGSYAFAGTGLKQIEIPQSVKTLGKSAFYKCEALTDVKLNNGLTVIGNYAFAECTNLKELSIPEGVSEIGERMMIDCNNLQKITLPSSIMAIGKEAFCCDFGSDLREIHSQIRTLFSFDDNAFYGVNKSNCKLFVPVGMYNEYRTHLVWGEFYSIIEENNYIIGDIDGSGIVDVDDVNAMINLILFYEQYKDKYSGNADVDGSGIVDVDDVNHVINKILGLD